MLENSNEALLPRLPAATPSTPPHASTPENASANVPRPVARTRRTIASPVDGLTVTRTRSRARKPVPRTFERVAGDGHEDRAALGGRHGARGAGRGPGEAGGAGRAGGEHERGEDGHEGCGA